MKDDKKQAKRVDIVSIKMVKDASVLYQNRSIESPLDAAGIVRGFLEDEDREKVIVVYLNIKKEPNAIHTLSIGSLNTAIVHPREVMKGAILSNAHSMIIAHNHPSSSMEKPHPSNEDCKITQRVKEAGKLMGIELMDHIIIGSNGNYYSFRQEETL